MTTPRIVFLGDSAITVEFEERIDPAINARAIALSEAIRAARHPGVRDIVPTYRSLTVHFDPLRTHADGLLSTLDEWTHAGHAAPAERPPIEVPVVYGGPWGPDLAAVAEFAGCSLEEAVQLHAGRVYRVYMLGFLPGYAYMGMVDARIAAPRHSTPRLHVPAGAVGIAQKQTSIYSMDSPGGWQLIGRTPVRTFDLSRPEPFLLNPGDSVRFVPVEPSPELEALLARDGAARPPVVDGPVAASAVTPPGIRIIRPGMLTTVQDLGRWGHQHRGVPVAGPMDVGSHRLANVLVGNPEDAATLEGTLLGPELEFERDAFFAVTGAEFALALDNAPVPPNTVWRARRGARLRFGASRCGARAYLAVAGGIDVPRVLGSRSTHVPSRIGGVAGRPLAEGDRVPLGAPRAGQAVEGRSMPPLFPLPRGGTRLRVLLGPQEEFFTARALATLQAGRYRVTPQSNRMGYRLEGPTLEHARSADTISDAVPAGAIQVPASGQPILLAADRQTTGGYPKIASVISADQSIAGQLAPGDWIEFAICDRREALAALIAQERVFLAGR